MQHPKGLVVDVVSMKSKSPPKPTPNPTQTLTRIVSLQIQLNWSLLLLFYVFCRAHRHNSLAIGMALSKWVLHSEAIAAVGAASGWEMPYVMKVGDKNGELSRKELLTYLKSCARKISHLFLLWNKLQGCSLDQESHLCPLNSSIRHEYVGNPKLCNCRLHGFHALYNKLFWHVALRS